MPLQEAVAGQHGLDDVAGIDPCCCPRCTACSPPTKVGSPSPCTSRSAGPHACVAVWPGYVDAAHGIAVDVGSTTIAGHLCDLGTGEVLASAGRMNPQIRFGEDLMSRVSYVMMNPGGDRQLTAAVRAGHRRARRRAGRGGRQPARPRAGGRPRRQPDHAPHRPRHRPDAARPGAVRAGDRRGRHRAGRAISTSTCPTPPPTPGRASPATSAPTPPRRSSPRDRTAARRCSCSSTSAPTPRSCSATAPACSPRRARPGRRSRAPRSAADSGRRPGRSSGCASTRRRWSRRSA